jgi:hypothetical protein
MRLIAAMRMTAGQARAEPPRGLTVKRVLMGFGWAMPKAHAPGSGTYSSPSTGPIHYGAKRPDGSNRHLITKEGDALYGLLEQHLQAIGYTGPKTAAEDAAEH